MPNKKLILIINADQAYIRKVSEDDIFAAPNDILFSAITDTYIPLVEMMERLEAESVPFKIGLVISPIACELLEDPAVQKLYQKHLEKRIEIGGIELKRNSGDEKILGIIRSQLENLEKRLDLFVNKYQRRIIKQIRKFVSKGFVEIIPTAATYAYLPHYADLTEALNAQIETGLYSARYFFGETGDGFYLPYLGWASGFEKILRPYGINYTVLDAKALLFAETPSEKGIFCPARTNNSLVLFGRDPDTPLDISGEDGYMQSGKYLSVERDVGFELPDEVLQELIEDGAPRVQTGYKYWAKTEDSEENVLYDQDEASEQVCLDAKDFFDKKKYKLNEAAKELPDDDALLVCTVPAEYLGQSWYEGMKWLEQVIRLVASDGDIELSVCKDCIKKQFSLQKITPYPCSGGGSGYSENLIDSCNNWMMRYTRKSTERMIELASRFPGETSLKARLLNLGAKEALLVQSSALPKMIQEEQCPDFAREEFKDDILSFSQVFDALASNSISTEWLTTLEKEHPLFPWINYRIFSKKK